MSNTESNYTKWRDVISDLHNADEIAQHLGFKTMELFISEGDENFKELCNVLETEMQIHQKSGNLGGPPLDQGSSMILINIDQIFPSKHLVIDTIYHAETKYFQFTGIDTG